MPKKVLQTLSDIKGVFTERYPSVTQVVDILDLDTPQEQLRGFVTTAAIGRLQIEADGFGTCLHVSISFPSNQRPTTRELVDSFGTPTKTSGVHMFWERRGSFRVTVLADTQDANANVINVAFTHSPKPAGVPKDHWNTQVAGRTYSSLPLLAKVNSHLVLLCFTADLTEEDGVWKARVSNEWMALDPDTNQTVAYSKSIIPLPVEPHPPVVVKVQEVLDYSKNISDLATSLRVQRERRAPWITSTSEEIDKLRKVVGGMLPLYKAVFGETT